MLEIKIDDLLNDEYVIEVAETKRVRRAKKEVAAVAPATAPAPVAEAAPAAVEAVTEDAKEEPRAKKGFFGRLFGR